MKFKRDHDPQQKLVYKSEFEVLEKLKLSIGEGEPSREELIEKFDTLCRTHYKLLKTVVKLTKVSDGYQKKLMLAKEQAEEKTRALEKAMAEIETLSGLLPICSNCKQIRDEDGEWQQIENYIINHSNAEFSHSLCPICFKLLYPKYSEKI
jgi:hypothetical protein